MRSAPLGEFEHLLLLTVLRLGADAYGLDIAKELASRAGRRISRGALYSSLDRLEQKGLLRWKVAEGSPLRDGLPRRLYAVTPSGVAALRESRKVLRRMWRGVRPLLKGRRREAHSAKLAQWLLRWTLPEAQPGVTILGDLLRRVSRAIS